MSDPELYTGTGDEAAPIAADLTFAGPGFTAEAAFDSTGRFRIVSLGRLIGADGAILAQHEVEAVVRLAERRTWTTQADLEALIASRQSVASYPESVPSPAHGPNPVTGGLRLGPDDSIPQATLLAALRVGDGAAAVSAVDDSGAFAGRPLTLLRRIGLEELADRWPRACVPMGGRVGGLTAEAAAHLVQISVVQP